MALNNYDVRSKAHDTIIIEERQNRRKGIMKIGFIGLGNMATAMIGGMLQKELQLRRTSLVQPERKQQ